MIFLTVGTWYRGFDRLVKAVDELAGIGVLTEEVIAQTGYGSYRADYLTTIGFCSPDDFANLVSSARLVVSHAGMGTVIQALKQCKPLIVVPRCRSLGEVGNNHQFATARQLEAEGKVLVAYDVSQLPARLKEADAFTPSQSNGSEKILQTVQGFILEEVLAKKLRKRNSWLFR
ncbi:MAG: glycosyltransferase [Planctomycetota bacterium]